MGRSTAWDAAEVAESAWHAQGLVVAGVDEVGRGCIAGPVTAGACILDWLKFLSLSDSDRALIRDSKTLSLKQREYAKLVVLSVSKASSVAWAQADEIAALGIVEATFLAMRRAISALTVTPDLIAVDGKFPITSLDIPQLAIIRGDSLVKAISAGAILAKCSRDAFMRSLESRYPAYGFAHHVGYSTREHLDALAVHGPCAVHRFNFEPIRSMSLAVSQPQP